MLTLLCMVAQVSWADLATFNVRSWDDVNKKVVTTTDTKQSIVITGSHPDDWLGIGDGHYYVVTGNVSYQTLNVFGNAHIILADGATLTLTGGLKVEADNENANVFIYSQSDGDNEGRLVVTNSYSGAAGIGASEGRDCGGVTIHGGKLDITGGKCAPGIGAGKRTSDVATKIKNGIRIFGGTVTARGGDYGAGIGGGSGRTVGNYDGSSEIYIYGGTVTAIGGDLAAGVGGGGAWQSTFPNSAVDGGVGQKVYVYGGTLTAQGGKQGAGIGGGSFGKNEDNKAHGGTLDVYGGTVNATGGDYGAGIGGGYACPGATVNISGGTVNAKGGTDAAGIGGGEYGSGGVVTISGGTVRAEGTSYGAGIGGGESTYSNTRGLGNNVTITGGTVIAIAGDDCKGREESGGSAIGCGQGRDSKGETKRAGSLEIPDNYKVTAGDKESDIERVFTSAERIAACRWRNYVKIEACMHQTPTVGSDQTDAVSYTIDEDTHTKHCRYCAYTLQESHTYVDNVCNACFKVYESNDDLWSVTLYRASAAGSNNYNDHVMMKVVKGQTFTIPAVSATEGLTLMGYATSAVGLSSIEMKDDEVPIAVGTVVTPASDMSYYARYRYRYVPTWTWNNYDATATLSITCSALSSEPISVTNITYNTDGDVKTATGTYVHDGATYTFTDSYLLPVDEVIVLHNNASNEETLDNYDGLKVKALLLSGRTLYADNSWNTLCLPFDLNETELYTYLRPSGLKTLSTSSYDSETGTLTLKFADVTSIEAGKPYLIKWADGGDRKNTIFNTVTINDAYGAVTTDYVDFIGSFSPFTLEADDHSMLYISNDNKVYYPTADMAFGSCRAVFQLKDITAGDLSVSSQNSARAFVLDFGDEVITGNFGETTGITNTNFTNFTSEDDSWYDLSGRKVASQQSPLTPNLPKGVYIYKGKKVVL